MATESSFKLITDSTLYKNHKRWLETTPTAELIIEAVKNYDNLAMLEIIQYELEKRFNLFDIQYRQRESDDLTEYAKDKQT